MSFFRHLLSVSVLMACLISNVQTAAAQDADLPTTCSSGLKLDWNCDGLQRVVVLGDSFVVGTGDSKLSTLKGYIGRSQKALPNVKITSFGYKGEQTGKLLSRLREAFNSEEDNSIKSALLVADIVFLDLGRNDRWLFGLPSAALANLKTMRSLIQTKVKEQTGISPIVVTPVLMLPNRGSQGPWVKELNSLILKSHKTSAPANLRFDLVSKRLLGADQIHPTSRGYQALSSTFVSYLKKEMAAIVTKLKSST